MTEKEKVGSTALEAELRDIAIDVGVTILMRSWADFILQHYGSDRTMPDLSLRNKGNKPVKLSIDRPTPEQEK